MPSAHGDNMDHEGGHPPSSTVAAAAMFSQCTEACNGADRTGLAGAAPAAPAGWTWEEPSAAPPVLPVPELEDGPQEMVHLPHLLAHAGDSPELLESAVNTGMRLIHTLIGLLIPHRALPDARSSLSSLAALRPRAAAPRTVVGVVGSTGAGKSSVINALLDEDELLPTNCVRACTASPTEVSYNHCTDSTALYRADVKFITREDWAAELRVLLADLLDGNGDVSRDCTNADSDAGVAYAKLKAVYPAKTKDMLAAADAHACADEPAVQAVLGTVTHLREESAPALYRGLQRYVDSKEKTTAVGRNTTMEYWPLVKVVHIYVKAAALSTGAVIVDLPGVQDSNAARAAVAVKYMRDCSGLWIVAPITRAVDEKTAKDLLGESFKRQLKYDGTYSAVTFICSKTDDLIVKEASRNLGMDEVMSQHYSRADALTKNEELLSLRLVEVENMKASYAAALEDCEASIDAWEDMESRLGHGGIVYAPSDPRKRKWADGTTGVGHGGGPYDPFADCDNPVPQTRNTILHTLMYLRSQRKEYRGYQRQLDQEMVGIRHRTAEIRSEREGLLAEAKASCIKGRNDYSREAIKQDFATGIRELDHETAAEEDAAAFDPEQDLRDYDAVARSLPVFCVSSRAFQSLRGKLGQGDFDVHGFRTAEDTEIPQLQAHIKELTADNRIKTYRRFLNDFMRVLNSMNFWAFNNGARHPLPETDEQREMNYLKILLQTLNKGFEEAVTDLVASIRQSLTESIYDNFDKAIEVASKSAVATCEGWGASRLDGGLYWSTYKATVRRNGVYKGCGGDRDFNAELFEPISRHLAPGWERAFQRRLPAALGEFEATAQAHLETFHQAAVQRARERLANAATPFLLANQISTHKNTLQDLPHLVAATITELQREASRESVPVILRVMTGTYELCTAEKGSGSFVRMKAAMVDHVDTARNTMFHQATAVVTDRLERMCATLKTTLNAATLSIMKSVCNDYRSEVIGVDAKRRSQVSSPELQLRASVRDVLRSADDAFHALLPRSESPSDGDTSEDEESPEPMQDAAPTQPPTGNGLAGIQQLFYDSPEVWHPRPDYPHVQQWPFAHQQSQLQSHVTLGNREPVADTTDGISPADPVFSIVKREPED